MKDTTVSFISKEILLFFIGGLTYNLIEIIYRQYTHWTMTIVGGLAFIFIGLINEIFSFETSLWKQMLTGSAIITLLEFISGVIVNILLGWNVWNYSNLPFNILGQICLPFSIIWFFLSFIAIAVDDYLRYWLWDEEKPHYKLF